MDIFSKKRANDRLYAYHGGRFWVWNEELHGWKESHLMAQKYELNHDADKLLSPADFLTDPAVFTRQQEAELRPDIVEALQRAQPCQNAPLDPVDETAVVQAAPDKPLTTIPDGMHPAFDYSGLDAQTVDTLHMAENQYTHGKKMAETGLRWMVNAVSMAHDALCGAAVPQWDNGKFAPKDDTFRAWCASLNISKSSAYRLLSVSEKFGNIELDGKSILDVQPATLLYEAAKPSAPADLVQKVTTGQITSSAEYRAILKENQQLRTDRVNAMNRADHAEGQLKAEKDRADAAEAREEEAWSMVSKAQDEAQTAKNDLEVALVDLNGLTEQNAKLEKRVSQAEQECMDRGTECLQATARATKAEQRAKTAEDALKHQPITGVVDKEEVQRQAEKLFDDMAGQLRQENDRLKKNSAQMERQMKAMTSRMNDLDQTDFETANYFANTVLALWNSCKGSYSRLSGDDLESTFLNICNAANTIKKEASLFCRQKDGYKGGESNA